MGFLTRNNPDAPLNMTKAIISIWFKIPEETWIAAAADWTAAERDPPALDEPGFDNVMVGVIPMITWGPQQTDTYSPIEFIDPLCEHTYNDAFGNPTIHRSTPGYEILDSNDAPTQPSFIGIRAGGPNAGSLVVHLQSGDNPTGSNMNLRLTACTYTDPGTPGATQPENKTFTDATYTITGAKDYFGNSSQWGAGDSIPDGQQQPAITNGSTAWHHVLLSWDLSGGSAIHATDDHSLTIEQVTDSYSMLWCALDDVNKNGTNLPALWLGMFGNNTPPDPNAMLSSKCTAYAFYNFSDPDTGILALSSPTVPSNPICIPGPASLNRDSGSMTPDYKIQMADVQIFTNRSIDTSDVTKRRLFITAAGVPADPAIAASTLTKSPEVLLRGGGFIVGTNSGTAGNFTSTGTISAYGVAPSL
ncbi:hypothetical protein [Bradyrhizobium elkanii]|uniref:hypothetical protein n=1 Tax=Bradyrhizobium elkanii TaxID=29448 RepID=UPI00084151C8|nr:hypothetical protein [Bradyrhizobium elkanii]ODM71670.1 hypothetical protein A6X20_06935 [Bradyrhizobium elkanii]ODM79042.1 hypothetical protein A6452_28520 [Bradyrhizobium elkanii]